jgi:peptidoglycan/LPS O-acetylase OafA/YrhL
MRTLTGVQLKDKAAMESKKFSVLDGMRGIAALLVLTRHTEDYWLAPGLLHNHSYLAVDLFFILSGFVISHAYAQKLNDGRLSGLGFMRIRCIRLWPVYALAALLGAAAVAAGGTHAPAALVASLAWMLLFLPSRLPGSDSLFALNAPSWSLFYEMGVNALYALTYRWLSDRALKVVLLGAGAGTLAIGLFNHGLDIGFVWSGRSLAGGALRAIFGIFLGVWLHRRHLARPPAASQRRRIGPWALIAVVTVVLLVPRHEAMGAAVDFLAVFVVFPVCVYFGARTSAGTTSTRIFSVLGVASYPIYVLHVPLSDMLVGVMAIPLAPYAPLAGVLFAALLVAFALALDRFFDQPVRRALMRPATAKGSTGAA